MAVSLPSDFTPIPQVLLPHARQAFVARSIKLLGDMMGGGAFGDSSSSGGPGMPIELVNEPTLGANGGQYIEGPTFARVVTANRRDITTNAGLTEAAVTGVNNKGVVVNRRTNLIGYTDDTYIAGFTPEQLNMQLATEAGEMVADDMCSMIVAALRGIVEAVSATKSISVWAAAARTNLSPNLIDQGRVAMGDRLDAITHLLHNSFAWQDMRSDATGRSYTGVGNLALQGIDDTNYNGLKRTMRNDANLQIADAGFDKCVTLLLGAGVLKVGFVKPVTFESIRFISRETKTTNWRADWDLFLKCNAVSYNSAAGGANPANATLLSSANWTDNQTSQNELALVELIHNASGLS